LDDLFDVGNNLRGNLFEVDHAAEFTELDAP